MKTMRWHPPGYGGERRDADRVKRDGWRDQGVPSLFGSKASRLAEAYVTMGVTPTFTCAPYQGVSVPAEGEVIGFATYFQFRGGLGYGHTMEHSILLHPELRGRGAGRALMAAIENHARAAGVHTMFAGVSSENPSGVAFHEAIGFARVAVLPEVGRKFGRWIDLVLLQKHL